MTPISFKASFIKNANIREFIDSDKTQDKEIAIVKLDRNDMLDKKAMASTANNWGKYGNNYAYGVVDHMGKNTHYNKYETDHYIVATKQKKDFAHLDSKKILGVALFTEKKEDINELKCLQVDPKTKYRKNCGHRKYAGVGTAIVEHIKTISKKPFEVFSDPDAINFYTKLGLKYKEKTGMLTYHPPFNFKQFCKDMLSKF